MDLLPWSPVIPLPSCLVGASLDHPCFHLRGEDAVGPLTNMWLGSMFSFSGAGVAGRE